MVNRLKAHDAGQAAPKPGEPMPPFAMPNEQGHMVTLDDLLSEGALAMTFHRGHWCPYCRINTKAFVEAQERIASDGAHLAAIMPERQGFAAKFKTEGQVRYPVLTDIDNGYALSLNLRFGSAMRCKKFSKWETGSYRNIRATTRGCCQYPRPFFLLRME